MLRPHGLASSTYKKREMKLTNPQKISSRLLKPHCLSSSTYKREMKLTKPQKMSSRLLRPHGTKPMPQRKIFILFFTAHRGLGFLFYYFFKYNSADLSHSTHNVGTPADIRTRDGPSRGRDTNH